MPQGWPAPHDSPSWMRNIEKRLMNLETRPAGLIPDVPDGIVPTDWPPANPPFDGGDLDPEGIGPLAVGESYYFDLSAPDAYAPYARYFTDEYYDQGVAVDVADPYLDSGSTYFVVSKTRYELTGTREYQVHTRWHDTATSPYDGFTYICPLFDITSLLEVGGTYGFVGQMRFDNLWGYSSVDYDGTAAGDSYPERSLGDAYWTVSSGTYTLGAWIDIEPSYGAFDPPTNYGNFTYTGGRLGLNFQDTRNQGYFFNSDPPLDTTTDSPGEHFVKDFRLVRLS